MKDYYSLEDKRKYYHWKSVNPRNSPSVRKAARKRYESIKESTIKHYSPKHITRAKKYKTTLGNLKNEVLKQKSYFDFLKNDKKHKNRIKERHELYDKELNELEKFRHRFKLSYKDSILVNKNHPKGGNKK